MTLPPLFNSKFPSFVKDCQVKDIQVYWYCPKFSQSRYPPGQFSKINSIKKKKKKLSK